MSHDEHETARDSEIARLFDRAGDDLTDPAFVRHVTQRLRTSHRQRLTLVATAIACCVLLISLAVPFARIGNALLAAADAMVAMNTSPPDWIGIAVVPLSLIVACITALRRKQ
jgi:hypothetical protein